MKFDYGNIVPIPSGFVPPDVWPEYKYLAGMTSIFEKEQIGDGIRWSLWPFTFEQYFSNNEPVISNSGTLARNRIVMWKRISLKDKPRGWFQFSNKPDRVDGIKRLGDDLTEGWNKNARRDMRLWQQHFHNKTYQIIKLPIEEYTDAYTKSLVAGRIGMEQLDNLSRKYADSSDHIAFWGVQNIQTKTIVAGIAIIFSPTYKSSTHVAPFITLEGRTVFAQTALVYTWFDESKKRGCPTAVSINFWFPGKPKNWKGFSEFKSHFGFEYVAYPPVLYKFVRGKLW
jgi:hypothetical protein